MVEEAFSRTAAARAIVERLVEENALDVADLDGLVAEIDALLGRFEARTRDAVDVARVAHDKYLDRRDAFEATARQEGFFWGDTATVGMRPDLTELLESSENVEEVYADDELLQQVLDITLLRYVADVDEHRLSRLREGCDGPRDPAAPAAEQTLADIGFSFPLWEAPTRAACLDEPGGCAICKAWAEVRFEGACYGCFRTGLVDRAIGTELGMIRFEDAERGITHGTIAADGFDPRGTEPMPPVIDGDEVWTSFRVAREWMHELLRTPKYSTWQGESWHFCCGRPMIFVGAPGLPHLTAWGAASGRTPEQTLAALFEPDPVDDADAFLNDVLDGRKSVYAFRCASCAKRRAHWDRD